MPQRSEQKFLLFLDGTGRLIGLGPGAPESLEPFLTGKIGKPFWECFLLPDSQRMDSVLKAVLTEQKIQPTRGALAVGKSGAECTFEFTLMSGRENKASGILVHASVGVGEDHGSLARLPEATLARLMEFAKKLNLISDMDPLVAMVCQTAAEMTQSEIVVLFLRDRMTGMLRVAGHSGMPEDLTDIAIHEGEGLIGRILTTGKSVREGKPPSILELTDPVHILAANSFMLVPLAHGHRNIGVLAVFSKQENYFTEVDLLTTSRLADLSIAGVVRSQVNRDLERLEASTRMILDEAPMGILAINSEGRISLANPEYISAFHDGATGAADVIGRNFFSSEIVLQNGLSQRIVDLLQGRSFDWEFDNFKLRGGRRMSYRVQGKPLTTDVERVVGAVIIFQDISTRLKATRALEDSEQRYRKLFEASRDALIVFRGNGQIIDVNHVAADMLSYSREDLINASIGILAPGSVEARIFQVALDELDEHGHLARREIVLATSEKEKIPAEITGVRISEDVFQIAARDVSDRVQLERRLMHSQKMEAIGTLAGGIAHDFNNLLASIMGYSSLLKETAELSPETTRAVEAILSATMSAKELTGQLLAFGRRGKYQVRPVELGDLLGSLRELVMHSTQKDVEVRTHVPGGDVFIMADRGQISAAIMAVLINARDAVGGDGLIELSLRKLRLGGPFEDMNLTVPGGEYAVIEVADSGPGIPLDLMDKIFDPYFSTKSNEIGSGLGLAVVDGIVAHHDGYIAVDPRPGEGAIFRIYIPLAQNQEELRQQKRRSAKPKTAQLPFAELELPAANADKEPGRRRVLVAEDEELIRNFCKTVLTRRGFDVEVAEDGQAAIEIFEKYDGQFDLILLDMVMPRLNGEAAFRKMKAIRPDICVLLSSGFSEESVAQDLFTMGVAGFIEKPYDVPQLIKEVDRVLSAS
ncbi:MAG: PAS domain S-box protein [Deltaproteobacteria bacterium]|nr:PAS domain S-box protein [Deltaproteobacteria bacterium]MCB9479857.1 PAS domain S-box protein [Deltaproteobacteria bacterium]